MKHLVILCAGLDSVRRGYETHMRRLFETLKADCPNDWNVTLVKRDGPKAKNEIRLPVPSRTSRLVRFLARFRGDNLYWEYLFFALAFLGRSCLTRTRIDRIYAIEPMVMKTLSLFRFLLPGHPELLFVHSVWMEPQEYMRYSDRIQEVNIVNYHRSTKYQPDKPIALITHFDTEEEVSKSSSAFRKRYGLGNSRILLNVGIVGREHKRTDYLLREAGGLPPDWVVLVCGAVQDQAVIEEGHRLLGDRFRHLSLPQNEMEEAYGAASLFVHCAFSEGFCLVIIEAMKAGLPLLVHNGELFQWMVKDPDQCLDMAAPGNLRRRLGAVINEPELRSTIGRRNREIYLKHYTWKALREPYVRFLLE